MREFVYLAKALADGTRLRVLCALRDRELCVCEIVDLLGLAQSTVSKHMTILHQAGLVDARKEGRWMHYRLAGAPASAAVRKALDWVLTSLAAEDAVRADAKQVRRIVREHDRQRQVPCCK
jgi:DNA-binding transcriptional ArsR family regulator